MNTRPLVSVIVPFLNEEKYIRDAIESVRNQSYTNWELLLVDDGSNDKSSEIARNYAKTYDKLICYLEHEGHQNRGPSASRNLGLRKARGQLVAFLDADDLWLPFKLEIQVPMLLSQTRAALLYGATLFWHGTERSPEDIRGDFVQKLGVEPNTLVEPPKLLTLLLHNENIHPANCSLLVRRELFDEIGAFEERFRMYEDTIFLAKAYLKFPVFITGECSAIYRLHANSTCHVAIEKGEYHPSRPNAARRAFLQWLDDYLTDHGVQYSEVNKALQRELWPYRHRVSYRLLYQAQRFWNQTQEVIGRAAKHTAISGSRSR